MATAATAAAGADAKPKLNDDAERNFRKTSCQSAMIPSKGFHVD